MPKSIVNRNFWMMIAGCLAGIAGLGWSRADEPASPNMRHWAFQPIARVALPPVRNESWLRTPVDRFVLARLESAGFPSAKAADKRTLIRRATFDLLGVPPTPDEVNAFLADQSPDAFEKLVDRLLSSPLYGERWGRHWMDVVRYADTAGDNADYPVPEARLYRDYIINAFNADKPYDQFVQEQLAGDLLARQGADDQFAERLIGTGFIALSRRFATGPFELMHLTVEDTIETTSRTFLGLSFRCARCHDHKFDPVTMEDYYALYGIFESTQYPYAGSEEFHSKKIDRTGFQLLLPPTASAIHLDAWKTKLGDLEAEIQELEKQASASDAGKKHLEELRAERKKLQRSGLPPDLPCAYAVCDSRPVDTALHQRGEPNERGAVVKRRLPAFLAARSAFEIPEGASGRLEFAQWLTRRDHPLTARVIVNRIWQHHFGRGIVATPSNFGMRGEEPSHPELLDWLATSFIENGWSIKQLHRLIVTSATYRQAPTGGEESVAHVSNVRKGFGTLETCPTRNPQSIDPDNRLLSHFPRRRLEAEAIRDAMMCVAGTLDLRRPGPHPFPKIDDWQWTQHNPFKTVYESRHRSVYLMTQRIQRHPYLSLFDGPDANTSTEVRTQATVPLQALYLMNHPFVAEQASAFARRVIASSERDEQRIRMAVAESWCRESTASEIQSAVDYLHRYRNALNQAELSTNQRELEAYISYARVLLTANEFLYVE